MLSQLRDKMKEEADGDHYQFDHNRADTENEVQCEATLASPVLNPNSRNLSKPVCLSLRKTKELEKKPTRIWEKLFAWKPED